MQTESRWQTVCATIEQYDYRYDYMCYAAVALDYCSVIAKQLVTAMTKTKTKISRTICTTQIPVKTLAAPLFLGCL